MTLKLCSIAAALALALGTPAVQAQQTPGTSADKPASANRSVNRDEQKAEKEKIAADYKAAKAKCDGMQGNQKDVCQKEAKGQEKVAKAELAAKRNPSARNERKVAEAKADAEYDVAKEKCEDMKGKEKSACEKDAKAKHNQAKADIKRQYASKSERPARSSATTGSSSSSDTSRAASTTK
jgi:hypothetical protein